MITTPITTPHFQSSVVTLLSTYISDETATGESPLPLVPPLGPADTPLTPSETISQLVVYTSTWIDLAAPDPVVAHMSRQVFNAEIAYAAFCGVVNIVVQGPKLYPGRQRSLGLSQYARAIQEALAIGPYLQLHILFPMTEGPGTAADEEPQHLSQLVREEFLSEADPHAQNSKDPFGTWDAWNVVRTVCKYNPRLSVGKNLLFDLFVMLLRSL
jgi:type II protein arginine methyltransferase